MLKRLYVKNFAIISELEIEFKEGMTVLTGETGAGKSLIIDTLVLLTGARADSSMIRYDESKAIIEAEFSDLSKSLINLLMDLNIKVEDTLTLHREISLSGKNLIKANNKSVSLVELKEISKHLVDIHVQHDLYRLFNQESYLSFIDDNSKELEELKGDYLIKLLEYKNIYKKYKDLLNSKLSKEEKLEKLLAEQEELNGINLEVDLDIKLSSQIAKLRNYDNLFSSLKESYETLENDTFSLDNIYNAYSILESLGKLDNKYFEWSSKMQEAYYLLDDLKSDIYKEINSLDFDERELEILETNYYDLEKLLKKYKMTNNELLDYKNNLEYEIEKNRNYDGLLLETTNKLDEVFKRTLEAAILLSNYRKDSAKVIEKAIIKEANDLDLKNIDFKIVFNDYANLTFDDIALFTDEGLDQVDFMVSFNIGEPLKPLYKVASGGEMSRMMLSFKSVLLKNTGLSLIVFDEIDTGVSGEAALMIAKKIKEISKDIPVLCISHLPQVAAIADNHYYISKNVKDNRTYTRIELLDYNSRVIKIAQILNGNNITNFSIAHAKELLNELK